MQFSTVILAAALGTSALARPQRPQNGPGGSSGGPLPGLNSDQLPNAWGVINEVKKEGLPKPACLAAVATCLQESEFYMYANPKEPESMNIPHQKVWHDGYSVGLFQQQPIYSPYQNVAADMDPAQSAALFLGIMKTKPNWETMETSALCQSVQQATAGNLYGQRVQHATQICEAAGFH